MDFGKLKGVLTNKKFHFFEPTKDGEITLMENKVGKKGPIMSALLTDMPERSLAIQMPRDQNHFFKGGYGKICDYFVIVPQCDNTNVVCTDVVLCEMKKNLGKDALNYACLQLRCSIPLFCYLRAALKTHFGDDGKIQMHHAIIAMQRHPTIASIGSTSGKNPSECYDFEGRKINLIINYNIIPLSRLFICSKNGHTETTSRKRKRRD